MKRETELMERMKLILCAGEEITPDVLFTRTRFTGLKETRQMLAYFARKYIKNSTGESVSYKSIGDYMGINHDSVIHSCKVVQNWYDTDKIFKARVDHYDKLISDMSGLYSLEVAVLLSEKIKKEIAYIKSESVLLDEIVAKVSPVVVS